MSIVVATVLSEQSLEGLRTALAIAKRRGDEEVFLVTVLPTDEAHDADDAERTTLVKTTREQLDAAADKLGAGTGTASTIRVRREVLAGHVDEALTAFCETENADVLIVAATGEGKATVLGRLPERIALRGVVPMLMVRDAEPFVRWASGEHKLRVLVGIDDSAACQAAIQFVKAMRKLGPVDIVVGHVYFPDEAARRYGLRHVSMVDATPELEALLVRDLKRRLGDVPGEGEVTIVPSLGLGRIGDHMRELADEQNVDLVLVGTRKKVGLKRLSSVSAVVMHDARMSVLCVPLSPDSAMDEVPKVRVAVAATDRSAFSNLSIPWAYGMVGDRGEVHIVHVVEDESKAQDDDIVAELLDLAPPSRMGVTTRAHVVHGDDPARTIAETAERVGADVICICSHGRSGLTRALVGSVADKLMRACHRPVLVLRPVE